MRTLITVMILTIISASFTLKTNLAISYFAYDGTSGNQLNPAHYSLTTHPGDLEYLSTIGKLKVIQVNSPGEIYQSGTNSGKLKVDADDANSTIHSDIVADQITGDFYVRVDDRIWVNQGE